MTFNIGFAVGFSFMLIVHLLVFFEYRRMLCQKACDGSAEYIRGKFYTIKEEEK